LTVDLLLDLLVGSLIEWVIDRMVCKNGPWKVVVVVVAGAGGLMGKRAMPF
jgi:F0F1-type ATP synthase assembly protein I